MTPLGGVGDLKCASWESLVPKCSHPHIHCAPRLEQASSGGQGLRPIPDVLPVKDNWSPSDSRMLSAVSIPGGSRKTALRSSPGWRQVVWPTGGLSGAPALGLHWA